MGKCKSLLLLILSYFDYYVKFFLVKCTLPAFMLRSFQHLGLAGLPDFHDQHGQFISRHYLLAYYSLSV